MSDNITIDVRAEALLAKIGGAYELMQGNLRRALTRQALLLQGEVAANKLTGQVLHVRTGTLRRSINQRLFDDASGMYASVGTNVSYARVHEYGFDGTVSIKQHPRVIKAAFGKPLKAPVTQNVRAHSRHIRLPERSFLRSALKEAAPRITASLRTAVLSALEARQ